MKNNKNNMNTGNNNNKGNNTNMNEKQYNKNEGRKETAKLVGAAVSEIAANVLYSISF